jgi:hypothetical protein
MFHGVDGTTSHSQKGGIILSHHLLTHLTFVTPACFRVLDALSKGISQPGIFETTQLDHFQDLFEDAIAQFEKAHEDTYMGRAGLLRRFFNRQK